MKHTGLFLVILAAAACGEPTGADRPGTATARYGPVELRLAVAPSSVETGGDFLLELEIENVSARTDSIQVTCSIALIPEVTRGDDHLHLVGAPSACYDLVWWKTLEPGERYVESYEVSARTSEGGPIAEGQYRLRALLMLPDAPDLRVWLTVEE